MQKTNYEYIDKNSIDHPGKSNRRIGENGDLKALKPDSMERESLCIKKIATQTIWFRKHKGESESNIAVWAALHAFQEGYVYYPAKYVYYQWYDFSDHACTLQQYFIFYYDRLFGSHCCWDSI